MPNQLQHVYRSSNVVIITSVISFWKPSASSWTRAGRRLVLKTIESGSNGTAFRPGTAPTETSITHPLPAFPPHLPKASTSLAKDVISSTVNTQRLIV
ncbi:hypothetical protein PG984_012603 [Apiospora sp. TS-2023a]